MNKCLHCGVAITDKTDVCPLCRCVVELEDTDAQAERYPNIRLKGRKLELVSRIALFLAIVLGALAVILNYTMDSDRMWSVIVVGVLAYLMLFLFYIIVNEHAGYRSKVVIGVACGAADLVVIDYVLGFKHWSLDYAIPLTLLAMDLMIIVVMFINIRNWQSYLLFQIVMIVCSGICVILSVCGVIRHPLMSYIALGLSSVMFLATFIIGGRRARNELKRRFHVM
jgi:hypothetical protein